MRHYSNELSFYEVTLKDSEMRENGRTKRLSRKILVQASGFGDAEQIVVESFPTSEITTIKKSKIHEVLRPSAESESSPAPAAQYEVPATADSLPQTPAPKMSRAYRRALERKARKIQRKEAWHQIMSPECGKLSETKGVYSHSIVAGGLDEIS